MSSLASLLSAAIFVAAAQGAWATAKRPKEAPPSLKQVPQLSTTEAQAEIDGFKPKDCMAFMFHARNMAAAVFQRRIEFYNLPDGVHMLSNGQLFDFCGVRGNLSFGKGKPTFIRGKAPFLRDMESVNLKPHKVLRFKYVITADQSEQMVEGAGCWAFLVATRMLRQSNYEDCDMEEYRQFRRWANVSKGKVRWFEWKPDEKADFGEFYGMFTVDGDLVFEVPFKASPPNRLCVPLVAWNDGSRAYFGIVRKVLVPQNKQFWKLGDISEVLAWTPDKGLTAMTVEGALKEAEDNSLVWLKGSIRNHRFKEEDLTNFDE